ncbi:MAG: DUF1705 domain-containing protein, partial [Methylophilaceae bacterium]|nr:DUF1705 domain-containing protein [Methylophilaceae bacterium]
MSKPRLLNAMHSQIGAIFLVVVFVMSTANAALFSHIVDLYPWTLQNAPFLVSLTLFFSVLTALFFMTVSFGRKGRWLIALLLMLSAQAAYYMDNFGVLTDVVMIDNIVNTDIKEVEGLMSIGMVVRLLVFGVLPAWLVMQYWPQVSNVKAAFRARVKCILLLILALVVLILPFTAGYTSFIREHKITRF